MESDNQTNALESFVATDSKTIYGLDWGDPDSTPHLKQVRDEWLLPATKGTVLEIGSGGGRWSRYFINHCERAILVDGTQASETAIRRVSDWTGFQFLVSKTGLLPSIPDCSIDYVFSFDVFVHFEPVLFNTYLREIARVLVPGGVLHFNYASKLPANTLHECFKYRRDNEIEELLASLGVRLTERRQEYGGSGSVLVEGVRV